MLPNHTALPYDLVMAQDNSADIDRAVETYAEAVRLVDPIRLEAWDQLGLTTAQLRIIFALYREPNLPLRELACRIGVTASTASGLVDKLARRDLLRREECSQDRRLVRHRLTLLGRQLAGEMRQATRDYLASLIIRLEPDEREQLTRGLRHLLELAAEAPFDPARLHVDAVLGDATAPHTY